MRDGYPDMIEASAVRSSQERELPAGQDAGQVAGQGKVFARAKLTRSTAQQDPALPLITRITKTASAKRGDSAEIRVLLTLLSRLLLKCERQSPVTRMLIGRGDRNLRINAPPGACLIAGISL